MSEADIDAVRKASVFVDTYAGATTEAGDIVQAIEAGSISRDDLQADLAELVQGGHAGRSSAEEITLFKSVGAAIEDLAAARLAIKNSSTMR